MRVCLAVTCHLHVWQNVRDLKCATAVTGEGGGGDTEIREESAQKGDPGEETVPTFPAGT